MTRIALCLPLLFVFVPWFAVAAQAPDLDDPVTDVRLVVDVSGSMAQADPNNQRAQALSLLLKVLPENSYAGVWTFGAFVNALVPHGPASKLWKEIALTRTAKLPAVAVRSDLPEAIRQATWDWAQNPAPNRLRHVVVLTDGEVDVADSNLENAAAAKRLLTKDLQRIKDAGIRIHGVSIRPAQSLATSPGLSGQEVLRRLAQATGGFVASGVQADALLAQFVAAIDSIAPTAQIPQHKSAKKPDPAEPAAEEVPKSIAPTFQVDSGVASVDLIWVAPTPARLQLVGPGGQRYTRSKLPPKATWHVGAGYELVSLEQPAPGLWSAAEVADPSAGLSADENAASVARMLVYADLGLELLDPRGALTPQSLQSVDVRLHDATGVPITDLAFLGRVEVTAELQAHGQSAPVAVEPLAEAGLYRATLVDLGGISDAVLEIQARSRTFARGVRMPFQVHNPVTLEIDPGVESERALGWFAIALEGLDFDTLTIAARVRQAPAPAEWVAALKEPGGLWKLPFPELQGAVEMELDIKGNYLSGKDFIFRSERLNLVFPITERATFRLLASGQQDPSQSPFAVAAAAQAAMARAALDANSDDQSEAAVAASAAEFELPISVAAQVQAYRGEQDPTGEPLLAPELPLWLVAVGLVLNMLLIGALIWWLRPNRVIGRILAQIPSAPAASGMA